MKCAKVYSSLSCEDSFNWKNAYDIITNVDRNLLSSHAPSMPFCSGQVYVFEVEDGDANHWWRSDTKRWENLRAVNLPAPPHRSAKSENSLSKSKKPKPEVVPLIKKSTFQLLSWDSGKDKLVLCPFERFEYYPKDVKMEKGGSIDINQWKINGEPTPYVVVHYEWKFDPKDAVNGQHGNTKSAQEKKRHIVSKSLRSPHSPGKTPIKYSSQEDPVTPAKRTKFNFKNKTTSHSTSSSSELSGSQNEGTKTTEVIEIGNF